MASQHDPILRVFHSNLTPRSVPVVRDLFGRLYFAKPETVPPTPIPGAPDDLVELFAQRATCEGDVTRARDRWKTREVEPRPNERDRCHVRIIVRLAKPKWYKQRWRCHPLVRAIADYARPNAHQTERPQDT